MKRNLLFALSLLSVLFTPSACASPYPRHYSADAIEAKIIDADTKQPLEGVIVVAHWPLLGGFEGNRPIAQMMVMETLSDKNGRLSFPAWGPLKRPMGYIRHEDPELILFKPGYNYRRLNNQVEGSQGKVGQSQRRSDWNGKTIELKPFKGTMKEYVERFHDLNSDIEQIIALNPEDCYWKRLPKTLIAIDNERKRLEQEGADPQTLDSVYRSLVTYQNDWYTKKGKRGCGSPNEFFQRYEP